MGFYVMLVAAVAALAGILFGYDTGVISGAILFIAPHFHLSPAWTGFTVSAVLFGALIGSLMGGRVADYIGRRKLLIITAIVFLVGTIGSAWADNVWMLVLGRIVVGLAIGIASFVAPLYISEIAPPRFRGMLVSLNQLAITIGIVVSYLVNIYFAKAGAWRWMLGLGAVPALILLLGMLVLPRSPRWMVLKGFTKEAEAVLKKLRARTNVDQELSEIEHSIEGQTADWRMVFQPWLIPALVVAFGLALFQQVTGINTIIYYAPKIFEYAGFNTASGAISVTLIIGIVNVLFTIIALPIIDLWGRRPLLLCGLFGMGLSLCVLGYAFHMGAFGGGLKWMALGSMVVFIASFAMSLGPIMWLVIAEVFPLEVRGFASSLAVAASWGFNMMVALLFPIMLSDLGTAWTFYIFTAFCILGWFFVFFMVPETKGVTLEKIEENLRAGLPSRKLGN
ncbi:MAG: MFS transporter [Gammaproteobacteria bacterium RIFCSPHIGHO2_12_FULL_41_15]|nr:MAG: MFS transporter [Gammaproteobacteria bacterium RIFCSPHIGHO2_12_FULL_41_15]